MQRRESILIVRVHWDERRERERGRGKYYTHTYKRSLNYFQNIFKNERFSMQEREESVGYSHHTYLSLSINIESTIISNSMGRRKIWHTSKRFSLYYQYDNHHRAMRTRLIERPSYWCRRSWYSGWQARKEDEEEKCTHTQTRADLNVLNLIKRGESFYSIFFDDYYDQFLIRKTDGC